MDRIIKNSPQLELRKTLKDVDHLYQETLKRHTNNFDIDLLSLLSRLLDQKTELIRLGFAHNYMELSEENGNQN